MRLRISALAIAVAALTAACGNSAQNPQNKTSEPAASAAASTDAPATEGGKVIYLNKAEFLSKVANYEASPDQWVYLGDKPCIVDFYASWCGPCRAIAPTLDELAKEYDGQIYIYKIDVDKEKELAQAFGIQSIPTLLFCPVGGEAPQVAKGALSKTAFVEAINKML